MIEKWNTLWLEGDALGFIQWVKGATKTVGYSKCPVLLT